MTPSRRRLRPIGAPGDGAPSRRLSGRPGAEDCTGLPKGAYEGYGRLVTFPDSAPRHRPGAPERSIRRTGGKIRACCLPPHAPEPSPHGGAAEAAREGGGEPPARGRGGGAGVHQCGAAGGRDSDRKDVRLSGSSTAHGGGRARSRPGAVLASVRGASQADKVPKAV